MNEVEETEKLKKRRRSYLKLNIMSLFFTAVSFISVTLAWFAYSGLVTTQTEVNVKAWYIEFNKNGKSVSNNIVISLNDIYPGMETKSEVIDIKNSGDSSASIAYKIKAIRILGNEIDVSDPEFSQDKISHFYPFHINMALSNTFADANDGTGNFSVSVSWPLDSNNDEKDTEYGTLAYEFQKNEEAKFAKDSSYQKKSAIEVVVSLEATQYVGEDNALDTDFMLGSIQLIDVKNNVTCTKVEGSCIKTYVLNKNNTLLDSSVLLLPDLYNDQTRGYFSQYNRLYNELTTDWSVVHRPLKVEDLLPVVSNDIVSSVMVSDSMSNQLIGYLGYSNDTMSRLENRINDAVSNNGYFRFKNDNFTYLSSNSCYWLGNKYDNNKQFALTKVDQMFSTIYGKEIKEVDDNDTCRVIPVIEVSKSVLRNESSS